mmetsp:Transcript_4725/g.7548  ORF Transcript_4725/g.7548 Transcript_4725/m.7548 type:complete len:210 (+) Transcript_4725:331-960(+)
MGTRIRTQRPTKGGARSMCGSVWPSNRSLTEPSVRRSEPSGQRQRSSFGPMCPLGCSEWVCKGGFGLQALVWPADVWNAYAPPTSDELHGHTGAVGRWGCGAVASCNPHVGLGCPPMPGLNAQQQTLPSSMRHHMEHPKPLVPDSIKPPTSKRCWDIKGSGRRRQASILRSARFAPLQFGVAFPVCVHTHTRARAQSESHRVSGLGYGH